ncbi:MAG TPA: hypothetical protein VEV38_09715, partial [Candidatus Eremiobacteraceae bacterium]|nr:hypothetical protein [Candidatus Eremiobacteraceae bacterium]
AGTFVVQILEEGETTSIRTAVTIIAGPAHALAVSLSWPSGASKLSLSASDVVPAPVALVRVDGAGQLIVQWFVDGKLIATSTRTTTAAGVASINLAAALPRDGTHVVSMTLLTPQPASVGTPVNAAISYAVGAVPPSSITFPSEPDPTIPKTMLRYELEPNAPTESFVAGLVATGWPGSTPLAPFRGSTMLAAFSHGRMVAYVDKTSGDAEVFSDIANTKAAASNREAARAVAERIFDDPKIIPKDGTSFETSTTSLESETDASSSISVANGTDNALLTYVTLRRSAGAGKFPVFGTGSRALIAVDGSGRVRGFLRRWRSVKTTKVVESTLSDRDVRPTIVSQLSPFIPTSTSIEVDRIGIGYYDADSSYLQPVVYYYATIRHGSAVSDSSAADHFIGYLSIANPVEQIPPAVTSEEKLDTPASAIVTSPSDPVVSLYVIRNSESTWRDNADALWSGIASGSTAGEFTRREEVDAQPSFYLRDMNAHVNGANIADSEGHGRWWHFATAGDTLDGVNIGDVSAPGYGAASGGKLAYWVIHACEVIPSKWDVQQQTGNGNDAFKPWWHVFGGVREVLGYRTEMYVDDDVERAFGEDVGRGGIALSSWFDQIAAAPIYQAEPHCTSPEIGADVTCGRASAMVVDGQQDDAMLTDFGPLPGSAKKLVNYWMTDR